MILVDMHVHSTYSDGTLSVGALAAAAKRRHLAFISLTDHDTTDGLAPFIAACRANAIECLTGIELSADAEFTLHVLGYRISHDGAALENRLGYIRARRDERNAEICRRLQKLGMDVTIEEAAGLSRGQVVARPHIARLMIQKGYAASIADAFTRYIGLSGSAYVPRVRLSAEECISLISGAGGLAVLAHPAQTRLDDDRLEALVKKLRGYGLWGIEAGYASHSPEQIYKYLTLGEKYGLFPTAGSDFHGGNSPGIDLGVPVSEDFMPWARLGVKI